MVYNPHITCIAIDDEPRALRLIESYCDRIPSLSLLESFNNPIEAYSYLKNNLPDIIFIDINMPEFSGIQLIKNLEKKPLVIFTTAYSKYAVESYSLEAVDYLLKPYDFERFNQAVQKAKKQLSLTSSKMIPKVAEGDSITVKIDYKSLKIKLQDIIYLEAMDNYVKIFTANKCHIVLRSLKSMLEELPGDQFIQVHKSFVVALSKIDYFMNNRITIGHSEIPIGRVYLKKIRDLLQG
jgi:DNA-binding LytR/AlgR family response regulator